MFYKARSKIPFNQKPVERQGQILWENHELFFSISAVNIQIYWTLREDGFLGFFLILRQDWLSSKLSEWTAFKAPAAGGTGLWKPEPFQPFFTFFSHSFFRDSALWSDIFFSSLICFSLVCRMTWDSRSRLCTTGERGRQTQTFRPGRRASLCLLAPQAAPDSTILLDSKNNNNNNIKQ